MNVLFMFAGVLIVYLIVKLVFRYNWSKGLSVDVMFDKSHAVKGETRELVEVVTNNKRLPLPCINLKFQIGRELVFVNSDTNSSVSDKTYRNDVFSFLANQRITRRIPVKCTRRGVFRISGLELTFSGPFMNEINVMKFDNNCEITVFPKAAEVNRLNPVNSRVMGEVERRKFLLEDPFVFRGIRDYNSNDSLKNVNWRATARTGNLMVNEFDESVSRNVCILLNLEEDGALRYDSVSEEAISVASGMAQMLIAQGVSVSVICNGRDIDTRERTVITRGSGMGHLNSINAALARIDLDIPMEEYSDMLGRLIIEGNPDRHNDNCVYVVVSASRRRKLQEVLSEIAVKQDDFVWIVPHLPGCEYELEYCNITPIGWSVNN